MMLRSRTKTTQCGICLEEHPEDHIVSHQEICVLRLVFRCTHCNGDFMSKEGLWNHLDLHEVADENKELNYLEVKARHKVHQCELCNDQRAYSESSYWKHVHEVHGGSFLTTTTACGEYSLNEQLRNDHALRYCKNWEQTPTSNNLPINAEETTSDQTNVDLPSLSANNEMSEKSCVNTESDINDTEIKIEVLESVQVVEKKQNSPILQLGSVDRIPKQRCKKTGKQKCPYCPKIFTNEKLPRHLALCVRNKFSCKICQAKFRTRGLVTGHMRRMHHYSHAETPWISKKQSAPEWIDVNDTDSNMTKEEILAANLQKLVQNPLKCLHCGMEFFTRETAANHVRSTHMQYRCNICDIVIYGNKSARHHKVTKHTEPLFECDKCSTKFFSQKQYDSHISNCDGVRNDTKSPEQDHSDSDDLDMQMEIKVEETQLMPCEYTEHSSTSVYEIRPKAGASAQQETGLDMFISSGQKPKRGKSSHVVTRTPASGASSMKCPECEYKFLDYAALTEHFLRIHIPISCDICGTPLASLNQLVYHRISTHMESKFSCPKCSKKCITKQTYKKHVRFCEKMKAPCDDCGQWLKDSSALRRHKLLSCRLSNDNVSEGSDAMEKNNGLLGVKCPDCGKHLLSDKALCRHFDRIHFEQTCDVCGIAIVGKLKFSMHKKDHDKVPINDEETISDARVTTESDINDTKIKIEALETVKVVGKKKKLGSVDWKRRDGRNQKCPHCLKMFRKKTFLRHSELCERRKISCEICQARFRARTLLKAHMQRVHRQTPAEKVKYSHIQTAPEWIDVNDTDSKMAKKEILAANLQKLVQNPLKCLHCGIEFFNPVTAANHVRSTHMQYRCNICDIVIYGGKSARHHKITKHTEPLFECGKCSTKFFFQNKYDIHIRKCDGVRNDTKSPEQDQSDTDDLDTQMELQVEDTKLIPCEYTENPSTSTDCPEVNQHEKRREAGASAQKETGLDDFLSPGQTPKQGSSLKVVARNPGSGASSIKCPGCARKYFDYAALTEHFLRIHIPVICDICGASLTNVNQLVYHKQSTHMESKYSCQKCSKKCITKQIYDKHVLICGKSRRRVKKSAKCPDCGKEFRGEGVLRVHFKHVHMEKICDVCGITIFGTAKFKWHKLSRHSKPKYRCPSCGIHMFTKARYSEHTSNCKRNKHTCETCGRNFKKSSTLERHKIKDHRQAEPDKSDARIEKLKTLRVRKKKHYCKICGIVFPEKDQVNNHMRKKHSDEVFECGQCSMIIIYKRNIDRHQSNCEGKKFSCELCGQKFKRQIIVERHKIRVHSGKIVNTERIEDVECTEKQKHTTVEETQRDKPLSDYGKENSALNLEESTALQTISKHPDNIDESQLDVKEEVHTISTAAQDENITIKMEIQVEETMLQI